MTFHAERLQERCGAELARRRDRSICRALLWAALSACGGEADSQAGQPPVQSGVNMDAAPSSPAGTTVGTTGAAQSRAAEPAAGSGTASRTAQAPSAGASGGDSVHAARTDAGATSGQAGAGEPTDPAGTAATVGSAGSTATAGAAGTPGSMAEPEQPCAAMSALGSGDNPKTLSQDGSERRYNVYVPSTLPAMQRVPLVLDFHGNYSSGAQEESGSGWRQKADAEGFIVVYPDGVGNGWNVGNCCGEALANMVDDVGFARAIVESVSSEACIDAHRVYATGISNGAGLAHRLACEAADIFAAIAAASADLVTDPCTPARPISELSVRGLSDTLVNYDGGNTGSTGWYSPGAKGTLDLWKDIDGCAGSPNETLQYCESYTQCSAGVEVTLCSLPGTGHILYENSLEFSVPDTAWEMFQRQTLP